jgi:hypothetical protein
LFGILNFGHCDLPFDLAQGGELVEPFGICVLLFEIFNCCHSAPFTRPLLSKFSEDLIPTTQNVVSYQPFRSFGIPFTHKFQHLDMVFIADISKFIVF